MKKTIDVLATFTIIIICVVISSFIITPPVNFEDDNSGKLKFNIQINKIDSNIYFYKDSKKVFIDGTPNSLPFDYSDDNSIYFQIPKEYNNDSSIKIKTYGSLLKGYVDDTVIYEQENLDVSNGTGIFFNHFKIPNGSEGKTVRLQYSKSPFNNEIIKISNIFLDTNSNIVLNLYSNNTFLIILVSIGLAISFALLLVAIVSGINSRKGKLNKSESSMGIFTLDLGILFLISNIWMIANNEFFVYYFGKNYLLSFAAFIVPMVFPAPFLQFFNSIIAPKRIKSIDNLTIFFLSYSIIAVTLNVTNIVSTSTLIIISLALDCLMTFWITCIAVRNIIAQRNIKILPTLIGIMVAGIAILIAILQITSNKNYDNVDYVTIFSASMNFLFVLQIIISAIEFQRVEKNAITYEKLAIVDQKTNLLSKNAFSEYLASFNNVKNVQSFSIIVFDMNNLKQINDLFGHQIGDNVLFAFAVVLKDAFANVGKCYRYGGDEFIVSLENTPVEVVKSNLSDLELLIKTYNEHCDAKIDCAYGVAYDWELDGKISKDKYKKIFKLADDRMYQNKQKMKKALDKFS